jgi:acyl carrier protein
MLYLSAQSYGARDLGVRWSDYQVVGNEKLRLDRAAGNQRESCLGKHSHSKMAQVSPLELEVAHVIVGALNLEDVRAEDIDPDEPLFGDGLGLDSIDALEIALAISVRFGIQIQSDEGDRERIFASLRALSRHIEANRTK